MFTTFIINREIITSSAESKDGPEGGGLTVSCERQLKQMVSNLDIHFCGIKLVKHSKLIQNDHFKSQNTSTN